MNEVRGELNRPISYAQAAAHSQHVGPRSVDKLLPPQVLTTHNDKSNSIAPRAIPQTLPPRKAPQQTNRMGTMGAGKDVF